MCERAIQTLQNIEPKESGLVFTYKERKLNSIKKSFHSARTKAGIQDFRFHDLRHTFASRLVQGGVPLYNVMGLTGHKSLEMVQRYAHHAPDYQEEAIAVLDAREKPASIDAHNILRHTFDTVGSVTNAKLSSKSLKKMVPTTGIEPVTPALRMLCSTN